MNGSMSLRSGCFSIQDWHPASSKFIPPRRESIEEIRREGDGLRRMLEGRRVLDARPIRKV